MKSFNQVMGSLGIGIGMAMAIATPASAATTLNMSNWIPAQAPFVQDALLVWAKQVEEVTKGRVKVRMLPKAVTNPLQHFDAVKDGLADVTFIVHGYTPGRFVLTKMAELPFQTTSAESSSVAYNRVYTRLLAKADEHKGVKLLAVFTHGPGQLFLTSKPVTSLADLSGLKFRTGGGLVNELAQLLDVSGLMKPAPESYELLSSGVADGVFFAFESILSFKLGSLVKQAVQIPGGLFNTSFALIMNEDKFNALSAEDQKAVMGISGDSFARLAGKSFDSSDAKGKKLLQDNKAKVTTASPAFVAELRKATQPITDSWVKAAGGKGIDGREALTAFGEEASKAAGK